LRGKLQRRLKSKIELYEIASSVVKPEVGEEKGRYVKHQAQFETRRKENLSENSKAEIQTKTENWLEENLPKLTGTKRAGKAARLMLLLETDEAARIMAKLKSDEAEKIAGEMAAIGHIDSVEAQGILNEFHETFSDIKVRRVRGGVETAREILTMAFGKKDAEEIILKSVPNAVLKRFAFLNDLSFTQLTKLLREESSTVLALVLSCLEPAKASDFLKVLPKEKLLQVVLGMTQARKVSMELVYTVESTLQEKLRHIGEVENDELDGRSVLADILRHMDVSDERRLLDSLERTDAVLAEQIKEKLYTMDSVIHMRDRDLQRILAEMKEREIALLMKGQTREIRDRIRLSLPKRRRLIVEEESDIMGAVRRSEADAAVRSFLERLRRGEEDGAFLIIREEADLIG